MLYKQTILVIFVGLCTVQCECSLWHSYQFDSGVGNREDIYISKVIAQPDFKISYNVSKWVSGEVRNQALGITTTGFVILGVQDDGDMNSTSVETYTRYYELSTPIYDVLFFTHWNQSSKSSDKLVIYATKSESAYILNWVRIISNTDTERVWSWNIYKNVTHLNYIESKNLLLIASTSASNIHVLDIYRFSLHPSKKFTLIQSVNLVHPLIDSAITDSVTNTVYLSLPQKDHVRILKLTPKSKQFGSFKNITRTLVEHVTAFSIGIDSYLAIDGPKAGIYKFTRRTLVREAIEHSNLDGANYWLRVPGGDFRREDILLVQREISHDTHISLHVDMVLHERGTFKTHEEIECDYFGDVQYGLNCITDDNYHKGIQKAAVMGEGATMALVTRTTDGESHLFKINFGYMDVQSDVQKNIAKFEQRKKLIEQSMMSLNIDLNSESQTDNGKTSDVVQQINWNNAPEKLVNELSTEQLQQAIVDIRSRIAANEVLLEKRKNGRFDTLIVNGLLEVQGVTTTDHLSTVSINNANANDILQDIVRIDDVRVLTGHKELRNLQVRNLQFQSANGVKKDNLLKKSESLTINGDIVFKKPVNVTGKIQVNDGLLNNIDLENDIVSLTDNAIGEIEFNKLIVTDTVTTTSVNNLSIHNNYIDAIENANNDNLDHLSLKTMILPGNLIVEYINNVDFNKFIKSLSLTNIKTYLGSVTIPKTVTLTEDSRATTLNNLKFPEEYVIQHQERHDFIKFTGKKHFKTLYAQEATTTLLNDIEPEKLITLHDEQYIPGKVVFKELTKITELFDVDRNITGFDTDNFVPNPTIQESSTILANVNFWDLEVKGSIFIKNKLNKQNFNGMLKDVVYKTDDNAKLANQKQFLNGISVKENVEILSGSVNHIEIDQFVSKDSENELAVDTINGSVEIEDLEVTGLINNCNITQLDLETVKLSGDQFIESKFVFNEEIIITNSLEIVETINTADVGDILFTNHDLVIETFGDIEEIEADEVFIKSNLMTKFGNFNLNDFEDNRLSYSKDQLITGTVTAATVNVDHLTADFMNNHAYKDLFNIEAFRLKLANKFLEGKLEVESLIVDSLNVSMINGLDLDQILAKCIWRQGASRTNGTITFQANVFMNHLIIENFNSEPLVELADNIVYKNETDIQFGGTKTYVNGLRVHNYVTTNTINGMDIGKILHKNDERPLKCVVNIVGDVILEHPIILGDLNGIAIDELAQSFEVLAENTIRINGDVMFKRLSEIDELWLKGYLNGQNVTEILSDLVQVDKILNFQGTTTFNERITVHGNVNVKDTINGMNFEEILDRAALITQDVEFEDVVTFSDPITVIRELAIEKDLWAPLVMDIDMEDMLENTTYINRGRIAGIVTFDSVNLNGNLVASFINDFNMSSIIPLRTNQTLNVRLHVDDMEVFSDIDVANLVNGNRLESEFENTLMNGRATNVVNSEMEFKGKVVVRDELQIVGALNGRNLDRIVTTGTDQVLSGNYFFAEERVAFVAGITVLGAANGINVTDFQRRGLKTFAPHAQHVRQPIAAKSVTFQQNVAGGALVNGANVRRIADDAHGKVLLKSKIQDKLIGSYGLICEDVNIGLKSARDQLVSFKYFEDIQSIDLQYSIDTICTFKFQEIHHLLISERGTCLSHIFVWHKELFTFIGSTSTGPVNQFVIVSIDNWSYIVTRSRINVNEDIACDVDGSNLWEFKADNLTLNLVAKLEDHILLQDSTKQGTFFGLISDEVVEYRVNPISASLVRKYRKWKVLGQNLAFIPRDLDTGLAMRNGEFIFKLVKETTPALESNSLTDFDSTLIGRVLIEKNVLIPGRFGGGIAVMKVGENAKTVMVAIAARNVSSELATIKIYDSLKTGSVRQEIACSSASPSFLTSINMHGNGETLLAFLDGRKTLKVYEYKGIFGFVLRSAMEVDATSIQPVVMTNKYGQEQTFLAVVNGQRMRILETVMDGMRLTDGFVNCN